MDNQKIMTVNKNFEFIFLTMQDRRNN